MKLLGIDYGRRRIGIAVTDESGTIIRGLTTIDRNKIHDTVSEILKIITNEHPSALIVGLPLDEDNNETDMSTEIRAFMKKVEEQITLPVHFVDESYSSVKASDILLYRKKKDRRKKTNTDRIAACVILDTYIKDQSHDFI